MLCVMISERSTSVTQGGVGLGLFLMSHCAKRQKTWYQFASKYFTFLWNQMRNFYACQARIFNTVLETQD